MRAVIELNPSALTQAAALDEERRIKGPRGPLHGIPIILKDNVATLASDGNFLLLLNSTPTYRTSVLICRHEYYCRSVFFCSSQPQPDLPDQATLW